MSYCLRCSRPREAFGIGYCDTCEAIEAIEKGLKEIVKGEETRKKIVKLIKQEFRRD